MRRVKEKIAQTKTNKWADLRGILHTTLTLRGRRGWPDEVYWLPKRPLLIEFKAEGEEPRKLQAYIHEQLRGLRYDVEVHTKAEEAIASLRDHFAKRARSVGLEPRAIPKRRREILVGACSSRPVLGSRPKEDEHSFRSDQDFEKRKASQASARRSAIASLLLSVAKGDKKMEGLPTSKSGDITRPRQRSSSKPRR